ncbi:hypothetical protein NYE54_08360 [Paenibacillus sp. FSL K6-1330]|uniref:hypothetical protein n=1 Tax=Paenibacillus sp. FSL K6-1330 TaxID=2975292 RepID=UPI0030D87E60
MKFVGVDPATKTGIVILDEQGKVVYENELKGEGAKIKGGITTEQLVSLENQFYKIIKPEDEICIEQPAMGTQMGVTTGMIHGGLRTMIFRKGLVYWDVNPAWTKKYVKVTGFVLENGKKRRFKDNEKKKAMKDAVLEHFGYTHKSDNVVDAYIIARIALNLYLMREYKPLLDTNTYQVEVLESILNKVE